MNIKEVSIQDLIAMHNGIPEFSKAIDEEYYKRLDTDKKLLLIAYEDKEPAGYIAAYDRYQDGSIYCWMAGVLPQHRRKGILSKLMTYLEDWAKKQGYNKISIKTRNNKRQMLSYLVKEGFLFTEVDVQEDLQDNRIALIKTI